MKLDSLTISDSTFDFKTDTYIEKLNSPISCKEVRKALKSLNNTKSGGLDLILNTFLKYGAHRTKWNETKLNDFVSCFSNYYRDITRFVPFRL